MSDTRGMGATLVAEAEEQAVTLLPLEMDITNAEISGLAWHGDNLLILPQYPNWQDKNGDGCLLALARSDIIDILDYRRAGSLRPREVPFITGGLQQKIASFEGMEAIVVHGDQVFVTIEASPGRMAGYIVRGTIAPDLSEVRLDPDTMVEVPQLADIPNASYETLLVAGDKLVTIYENNGVLNVAEPKAFLYDFDLNPLGSVPFPNIEYRITDATPTDAAGCFWAMNFYYPGPNGKKEYRVGPDPLTTRFGRGPSHATCDGVERIVQLQYSDRGITFADRPPLQLQLIDANHMRNWEGLVTLDDRGFLIITDRFPVAMLGFVPAP